jgi:ferredoxin-thioredoxin reductase catalytic chain
MISEEKIEKFHEQLEREAAAGGYTLNPDKDATRELVRGLLINEDRYGYASCPCRLASGIQEEDRDIICPCDYRDPDLDDYGACYCALYVSAESSKGKNAVNPVPERRAPGGPKRDFPGSMRHQESPLTYPVWRCKVCGYLCAREKPPSVCPICKADKERFERFM